MVNGPVIASYTSLQQSFLNSMPWWAIFVLVVVLSLVTAWIATLGSHREYVGRWRSKADPVVVAAIAAMVLTLFALLLAFAIVTLYDQHQAARSAVAHEADDLAQLNRDSLIFGSTSQKAIQQAIRAYICQVVKNDFPVMHNGATHIGRVRSDSVNSLFFTLAAVTPATKAQDDFLLSSVNQLNDMVAQRRERIESVNDALPFAFSGLLILTALASVYLTALVNVIKKEERMSGEERAAAPTEIGATDPNLSRTSRMQLRAKRAGDGIRGVWRSGKEGRTSSLDQVIVFSVTLVVTSGLFVAFLLQFPFSGPFAISSHPYIVVHGCGHHV